MAATSHPLASLAAIDILRDGGSAADAAVAACAVLCVVEPHMTGIGGDCFTLVAKPGQPVWGYNGCGRSGATASADAVRAQGLREIGTSIHAVTVPGAIEAWEQILKAHGRFGLDRVLKRAIDYAENGFPVAARVAWDWARHVGKLKADPGCARHYLFNGEPPKEGDVVRFPALAATLKAIAARRRARVLPRRDRRRHGEDAGRARLIRLGGGFRRTPRRGRHADRDQLSRPRFPRDPAERAGAHRARHAQHPGEFRHGEARSDRRRALPSGAGGRASRLRHSRHAHRRGRAHARDGRSTARQRLRQKAGRAYRHE